VAILQAAVTAEPGPVWIVAHSAGCLTVLHWAARHRGPVRGALLVAPPYLDPTWDPDPEDPNDYGIEIPREPLPFPAVLVASSTDPHATMEQSRGYARDWGAELHEAGPAGHLDTRSGYGPWPTGLALLRDLITRTTATPS
jgi:predicted alpha/beta hydrolase family esterase